MNNVTLSCAERRAAALARCEQIEALHPDYYTCPPALVAEHTAACAEAARLAPSPEGWFRTVDGEWL